MNERRESGAVAVLFTILAVVLIGAGALAVDLGNAFARKRISQTQADLAALAGAAALPEDPSAAIDLAFDYLVANEVLGQGDVQALKTQLTNTGQADSDGEIWVEDSNTKINVLTPPAAVDYALGGVLNQNGIDVQAYAQAGVFSPGKLAPFFIPYGCSTPLPSDIFIKAGAESTPTDPDPVFRMPMASKNGDPSIDTVVPAQIGASSASVRTADDASMAAGQATLTSTFANFTSIEVGAEVVVEGADFEENGPSRDVQVSVNAGSAILTVTGPDEFEPEDDGAKITIQGAGPGGSDLVTTLADVNPPTEATLAVLAGSTVSDATATIQRGSAAPLATTITSVTGPSEVDLGDPADVSVTNAIVTITVPPKTQVEITGAGFDEAAGMTVAFVRGDQTGIEANYEAQAAVVEENRYSNPKRDALDVILPELVAQTADSRWYIQVRVNGETDWSFTEDKQNVAILEVSSSTDPGDQCGERVTGDFGLLNSPRQDTEQLQQRLDLNIARGFDHPVTVFTNTLPPIDSKDNCRITPQSPIAGGVLDDDANLDAGMTPNCLEINNGNKVDATTDGFITGGTQPFQFDGRLVAEATDPPCTRPLRGVLGENINDDVLSCFLQEGNIQSTIAGTNKGFRDSIIESPRFLLVPVLWSSVNPQNGYYPIQRFVGAFITDQDHQTVEGTSPTNTVENGVVAGTQKVTAINVIPFELDRLPEQVATTGAVIDYIGAGPKVVQLIK